MSSQSYPELSSYWFALGKFVHRYAALEAVMFRALQIATGVSNQTAQALFSGTRITEAINLIRRAHDARGETLDPMLERAFPKIAELTKARNDILHYGFNVDGEYAYVTNAERTILPRAFQFQMTVDSLDCLEADAITAYACLNSYCLARMAHPSITEEWIAAENEVALHAWRYKGARLTRHPDRNAEKPQDKKSQPLSSEA